MNPCQITVRKDEERQTVTVERRNVAGTAITTSIMVDDNFDAVLHAVERELREAFKVPRETRRVPGSPGWVYGLRLFNDDLGWQITVHETGGERRTIGPINEGDEADAIRALALGKLSPLLWHPAAPDEL